MTATTLPGVLLSGTHASRPAASAVASGALYAETDTGQIYQSDGASTWTAWGAVAASNPLTTKGDLIVGGTAGVQSRLGVGTNGFVLTADSAQTLGAKWVAAGGGWPPAFPSAPTLVESVAWASKNDGNTMSLASTPSTGDAIFVFQLSNQYQARVPTGGGATWYNIAAITHESGNFMDTSLWMGIVGGSPSATVTLHWDGNNGNQASLANFRGITGVVETCGFDRPIVSPTNTVVPFPVVQTSILSPLAIAFAAARSPNAQQASGGGFTDMQKGNQTSGWQTTAYKLLSQYEKVQSSMAGGADSYNFIQVLLY